MIAVDTNVLVRFLVGGDSPQQAALALTVFAENRVAVGHTVLLEAEWVLRRSFNFSPHEIAQAFTRLLGLASVTCARRDAVVNALRAFEAGCDFADALHTATAEDGVSEFVTFDRSFAKRADAYGLLRRVRLLVRPPDSLK